jgi:aminoglycoside phosphotransferase (APT) family kinase protein
VNSWRTADSARTYSFWTKAAVAPRIERQYDLEDSTLSTQPAPQPENNQHNIGTMAVAEKQRFDLGILESYLQQHVEDFQGPLTVEQFKGGQSNPTFKLVTPRKNYVMRSKPGPQAKLLPSAHAIEREYKVQSALADSDVPVSKMHCLCEDEDVIGRAFYIMDCVEGRVLWDQGLSGFSNAERSAIYDEMNRVISALHRVDFQAVGLASYGKPGNYFARQIGRWSKQYLITETEPMESMNRLIEWLPSHIPEGDQTTIVHGDYRLDNMIFDAHQPKVRAVLDWELSTLGHPMADFSYHCMSYHIPPGAFRGIAGLDLAALGIPSESDYIAQYSQRTGLKVPSEHWDFYMAYNLFRLAAILQGIMKRVVDGTASNQQAKDSGSRAKHLADMGWAVAQRVR